MIGIRSIALLSILAMAACGGGGSSSGGSRAAGFDSDKPATLRYATVAPTGLGSRSTSSNAVEYDPNAGTINTGSDGYSGPVADGEWRTDANGNRLRMTNPANTRFVRQVDMVEGRGENLWHRGVVGFETQTMPKSGKMTYNGTTSGQAMQFGTEGPTVTNFNGNVRVEADMASGQGSYHVSGVQASDGTSAAPFRTLSSGFKISGNQISSLRETPTINSGPGQPLGSAWSSTTSGAFYGPNAAEVGAGYQVLGTSGRVNGAFVAKR